MATVVFPQTDDTATVAAWADMIDVVNRGAEDPLTVSAGQGAGSGQSYATTGDRGVQIWDVGGAFWTDTTYKTVYPTGAPTTFTAPAGEQWFTELFFSVSLNASDGANDPSRVRLTAPAGGTWTGFFITSETALSGSNVRCRRFNIANGATLVMTTDWRNTVGINSPMSCMIVATVTGTTTGGTIKVEASHTVDTLGTNTQSNLYGGKTFFNAVRILG
jgi:hypothetical protein